MKPPFNLSVRRDGEILVVNNCELICHTEGATSRELDFIVEALNLHTGEQHVVAQGNAFDGIYLTGPFPTQEEAQTYGESCDGEWWVVEIKRPA